METLLDEAIQIGRLNLVVSQSVNRVPALVIGKNEQDVGTLAWLRGDDVAEKPKMPLIKIANSGSLHRKPIKVCRFNLCLANSFAFLEDDRQFLF